MKSPENTPEKISINLLYQYLGLSAMTQAAKLDALISYSQDSGLLFTFHRSVKAMQASISIGEIYDDKGEFIEFKPARDENIQYIEAAKSFMLTNYNINKGKTLTCINNFKESGVLFNVINASNSDVGVFDIDLAHVYIKKSDYSNFIKRLNSPPLEIKELYQDINSEYYSPELDLAIQLHHDIHIGNFGNVNQPITHRVGCWLNKNKPDDKHSEAKIKRLSSIIGINKKTG